MNKLIITTAVALIATVASAQSAYAWVIIPWPGMFGSSNEVTSPGEPFQPFKRERHTETASTASADDLAEACEELGGKLVQIQDGSVLKLACIR